MEIKKARMAMHITKCTSRILVKVERVWSFAMTKGSLEDLTLFHSIPQFGFVDPV